MRKYFFFLSTVSIKTLCDGWVWFFFFAKILLFLEKLLIKKYYLHWYEIFCKECRMSVLHPIKILNLHLLNFLWKWNFSVRENRRKYYEKSKCTRMLSIRVQFEGACWAYDYNLYPYAEHAPTIWTRMLSIRLQFVHFCSACAYKKAFSSYICKRTLIMRIQVVGVCWAYAYNLNPYAKHAHTICMRILSIRMPTSPYYIKVQPYQIIF